MELWSGPTLFQGLSSYCTAWILRRSQLWTTEIAASRCLHWNSLVVPSPSFGKAMHVACVELPWQNSKSWACLVNHPMIELFQILTTGQNVVNSQALLVHPPFFWLKKLTPHFLLLKFLFNVWTRDGSLLLGGPSILTDTIFFPNPRIGAKEHWKGQKWAEITPWLFP